MTMTSCQNKKQKADLILINGTVYTVNADFSECQAFAVNNGKFIATGTNEEILNQFESAQVYDAQAKPVYPGFIDGHCHFFGYGENLIRYAELAGSQSFDEVIARLEAHNKAHPSEWILGRGWDQNRWTDKQFPDNRLLEEHFPGKKIFLIRIDGHAVLVSKSALEAAAITAKTKVEGGEVQLLADGTPSGILIDKAEEAVKALIPALTIEEKKAALMAAQDACFAVGLSGVVDAGLPLDKIKLIDSLQKDGALKMKINAMLDPDETTLGHYLEKGPFHSDKLSVTAVKMYADGALGSRGAWLLEPYSDDVQNTGLMLFADEFYETICKRAYDAGFQVNMHAIGDQANRYVLELYSRFLEEDNDRRWRVEHAQIVHPDDFKLFSKYNIIPSIQSTHATSDMLWAPGRIGEERMKTAYAQQQLMDQNGWLINGTDFPIEGINPLETFYSAVFRKNADGVPENGFQMENALSRENALRSITIWAAKGHFEEDIKGSIEVGKAADFVVLDHDILEAEEQQLKQTKVVKLIISGEEVYNAGN
ncbi:MAG: amidohydrolase [Bacteroidetes bacterium]|nr:amidohydrolase [Bacteroidota bacterium]MBU1579195.1 amidohydrolase [Bacteroidota bacterium]MBU2556525.1 amidohydrolase [Bacteroidota bacterium]